MSDRWLDDLKPIGTDDVKPFLEEAPYLIIVFKRVFERDEEGKVKMDLSAVEVKKGSEINVPDIYFSTGSSNLKIGQLFSNATCDKR